MIITIKGLLIVALLLSVAQISKANYISNPFDGSYKGAQRINKNSLCLSSLHCYENDTCDVHLKKDDFEYIENLPIIAKNQNGIELYQKKTFLRSIENKSHRLILWTSVIFSKKIKSKYSVKINTTTIELLAEPKISSNRVTCIELDKE